MGAFILCLIGPEVILILGGPKYLAATKLMPVMMLGCFYNFMNLFYVNIEFYEKKTIMISVTTVFTAILNVGSNYVCIKIFGYSADAYTTACCNFIFLLMGIRSSRLAAVRSPRKGVGRWSTSAIYPRRQRMTHIITYMMRSAITTG